MKPYEIRFSREAAEDVKKLSPYLRRKLKDILVSVVATDPRSGKKLAGDLVGFYSIRLSYRDRIVYSIDAKGRTVYVHRARTHYGD